MLILLYEKNLAREHDLVIHKNRGFKSALYDARRFGTHVLSVYRSDGQIDFKFSAIECGDPDPRSVEDRV
ncbi:hypothetical protein ACFFWD_22865 [Bradyrhizobium erythrophlei]|uniref:hypothetical protein n=1 Tax=Bradyrhizobium erythrophlei TaxID=1437360 RepID=UPI0035E7201A